MNRTRFLFSLPFLILGCSQSGTISANRSAMLIQNPLVAALPGDITLATGSDDLNTNLGTSNSSNPGGGTSVGTAPGSTGSGNGNGGLGTTGGTGNPGSSSGTGTVGSTPPAPPPDININVTLNRVCMSAASQARTPMAYLEKSANPILALETAILGVPVGQVNLSGVDLSKGSAQVSFQVPSAKVQSVLGSKWASTAVSFAACDDKSKNGACFGENDPNYMGFGDLMFLSKSLTKAKIDVQSLEGISITDPSCNYQYDPLVIDLAGDKIALTSIVEGVRFDQDGSGNKVQMGWVSGADNAFLVHDLNHNGVIDNGTELFGTFTHLGNGSLAADGFEALKDLDSNGDGVFDAKDAAFKEVLLWIDKNHDGISQPSELFSLAAKGVVSVDLKSVNRINTDGQGNQTTLRSLATVMVNGKSVQRVVADIWFATLSAK